jgi:LPXTG-motif cell wall-anchored protein
MATIVVLAGAASAQTATTVAPSDGLPAENPNAGAAGLVFFAVVGIIIIGGVLLYLRNRPPRDPTPG